MNISELSIRRPVLSTVLTLIILLFGFIGYNYLGVREYPSVDNPIISVSCSYPGANADVIENQITEPLEQNINGIPGIRSLSSVSQQGSSRITVEFELSVDLETAANDVRDKVSRAQRYLPRDCDPPTVSKADADAMPILMVALQSDKRSLLELSEIADLTVKEQLQTISDVSSVSIWGEKRYSMRLWLDPIKMSGYGITPIDVKNAVDNENVELPSGSIEGNTIELTIRTLGLMHTAEEFNNLILKEDGNRIVRFSDIGRAELGPADIKSYMKMNGVPMVGVVVIPQPGANHIQIADAVYERMENMKKDLPEDVHYSYGFDNTKFIRASIDEVKQTVYEAFVLVIIIIFLFLRDWRVTLVPCIVIPVSLIGAFFVMYLAGFSINVLSMLAIVLAVGLVVDDAIVMTENIYVRIEKGMPPKEAGIEGAKEIFFAVISTTITLVAVFFPIVFMDGMTGRLFREFSIVVSGSVIISSFAALTFTPMLATKLLIKREKQSWFYRKTEPFFEGLNNLYSRSLAAFLRKRWIALPFTAATILIIGFLWNHIPAEMAPLEDRSQISINTRGAEGVTYEYIRDYTEDINQLVDSIVPDAEAVTAFIGKEIHVDWEKQDTPMVSRRILVTKPEINGKTLGSMHFRSMYGVNVTRINRSGMDLFADPNLILQVGDRVMVVGQQDAVERVAGVLGNQLKRLDTPNIVTIFVGIFLGILLGSLPIAFPGMPTPLKLGLAGGPLVVAILIGRFGHKLHLVTYTTMSANLMLREIGIVLFLASVGIDAGANFVQTVVEGDGLLYVGCGFLITVIPLLIIGAIARLYYKVNYFTLMGLIAGSNTDPPALAYANQTTSGDAPAVGYSTVYPLSMFLRILTGQMILLAMM